jgi:alkylation response protein AidB-like acyl-CoA dehydrogenase
VTDDRDLLVEAVRTLARERIAPRAAEVDRTAEFPWDAVELMRQNDVFALAFPEEYGGTGTGFLTHLRAVEELSWADATVGLILAVQGLGGLPVLLAGTEAQKQAYVPRWASGEWIAAYALTEPAAGSDAQALGTRARRDGGDWVLDGTKRFITNAGVSDAYTVFATRDPELKAKGISAFLVYTDDPGVSFGKKEDKMGIRGSPTREVYLDGTRIPADRLIGEESEGFAYAMRTLDYSRPTIAAQALGIAQGAFDVAARYATERHQFGTPISHFEGLQFMLADMAMEIEASRLLVYRAASLVDAKDPRMTYLASVAKCYAADTAMKVTTDAVQILGGYGYMHEYPVERMMRDAKITQIYEGTNQIQRVVIARDILKRLPPPPG